ncbi:MAG: SGNH/GDSL hydrolase family protein [Candidatus Brocadiales bacterium]|nr:SGNH/GDSL hydrolase family protein [Candidatus Brocadiales bacterium]
MIKKFVSSVVLQTILVCLSFTFLSTYPLIAKEVIVAIGDSITQADTHWTVNGHKNTIQGGWVTRLGNLLDRNFPGEYEVVNKGINGDTALGVLQRLDRDVVLLQPDIVVIAIGTNDIFASLSADPSSTPDAYRTTISRIFNKLQLNLPDTTAFAMGMTTSLRKYAHMRFGNFLPQQDDLQAVFNDYNNILRKLTKDYKYFYVDLTSQWPEDIEVSWKFCADGIHPNDAGYDLMTEILYDAIQPTAVHPEQQN